MMNYLYAKGKATELLLKQKKYALQTPVFNLTHDLDIIIDTFSNYDRIVGKNFFWTEESYMIHKNDKYLILYDDKINPYSRIRWSIAHEFGHIYLNHETDDKEQEIEAHIFASQLLLPDIIVTDVINHGYQKYIPEIFGVSRKAANKFLFQKSNNSYNKKDKLLLSKYRPLLNHFYEFYNYKMLKLYAI